jgi:hypothetical protein
MNVRHVEYQTARRCIVHNNDTSVKLFQCVIHSECDRIARGCCQPQASSEPCVTVSRHTAQASIKAEALVGPPAIGKTSADDFAILTRRHHPETGEEAPSLSRRHMRFFLKMVRPVISQKDTRWTSALFRAGQRLNPYPPHYGLAFACSNLSIPHLH